MSGVLIMVMIPGGIIPLRVRIIGARTERLGRLIPGHCLSVLALTARSVASGCALIEHRQTRTGIAANRFELSLVVGSLPHVDHTERVLRRILCKHTPGATDLHRSVGFVPNAWCVSQYHSTMTR
jgi:hypothetical protein